MFQHLLFVIAVLLGALQGLVAVDEDDTDDHWNHFKVKYQKTYATEDEEVRSRQVFEKNMLHAVLHNIKDEHNYTKEVNVFSDMDPSEVIRVMCKTLVDENKDTRSRKNFLSSRQAKDYVNWVDEGKVSPVRDQGSCGSCWSFAAVEAVEAQYAIQQDKSLVLSPQELVDCSYWAYDNWGCDGGLPQNAYRYMMDNGITDEDCYPYKARKSWWCKGTDYCDKYTVVDYVEVGPKGNEEAVMQALDTNGPLAVAIHASKDFVQYKGGVYHDDSCDGQQANHAVLLVGYGIDDEGGPYWLIQNSWGDSWGEDGYVKMARTGENMCDVASHASYPVIN